MQEFERESGLVVPAKASVGAIEIQVRRAIVLELGLGGDFADKLENGTPVWYQVSTRDAIEIAGTRFITYDMILAWED